MHRCTYSPHHFPRLRFSSTTTTSSKKSTDRCLLAFTCAILLFTFCHRLLPRFELIPRNPRGNRPEPFARFIQSLQTRVLLARWSSRCTVFDLICAVHVCSIRCVRACSCQTVCVHTRGHVFPAKETEIGRESDRLKEKERTNGHERERERKRESWEYERGWQRKRGGRGMQRI